MFNMDNKSKGVAWVGNIYQKFEAMCMEVDDKVCQETLKYVENQLQTVGANVQQFCSELMQDVLPSSPTNSGEELNLSLMQNAGVTACEASNTSVDEDHCQKELIHSSSFESVEDVRFGLSSEQSKEDESALAHCSGSTPTYSVILAEACKNELRDIDASTLDDTSFESTEEAGRKSVSKVELEAVPVPSVHKVKLEESCIIVDSSELQSLSTEAGERRSYKKKFREAFSSKSRSAKRDNEQQVESSKEKGNGVGLYNETKKSELQDMEFCESDWEII